MSGAGTGERATVWEYLHSEYEPDAEYVDGEIEERAMGEFDHAAWQRAVMLWFARHEEDWCVLAIQELRVQVSGTRYRVPDVTVLRREQPREQIITQAPRAVFEVLSPEDRLSRMLVKLGDYQAMGIGQIWVIEPEGPVFYRFLDGSLRREERFEDGPIGFAMSEIATCLPG